jgi:hypothetical protein
MKSLTLNALFRHFAQSPKILIIKLATQVQVPVIYACPFQKLYPDVSVMQSTENGDSNHTADALGGAFKWSILSKCQMCAHPMVIGRIGSKNTPQMALAEDHEVIQALAASRSAVRRSHFARATRD